jgi:tetratricopeptide (TPR) repeat protein
VQIFIEPLGGYYEALEAFDRILIMEPHNVEVPCKVASIKQRKGDFCESLDLYNKALESCKSPQEKARSYSAIQYTYQSLLQYRKALQWHAKPYEQSTQYTVPMNAVFIRIKEIFYQVWMGDTLEGARTRDEIAATFSSIFEDAVGYPIGAFAAAVKDSIMSKEALEQVIRFENAYSVSPEFSINIKLGFDEARNDYKTAIKRLEEFMASQPGITVNKNVELARHYRLEADLGKAEKSIMRLFEIYPGNLDGNFEHARVLYAQGKIEEASKALDYTLSFWKDADPEAVDYKEAIELRATLYSKLTN